ncbi:MAG: HEAT repeat domain-containing protein [Bacteroidota bacterium]|nr:HEAT repeat domain-containing protein [Bacteroidota bacterium]
MFLEKNTISPGEHSIPLCIEFLLLLLQSEDGVERTKARKALVRIGKPAVPYILALLGHSSNHVRWEACKALERIRDPKAASLLARKLMDDDMDVRWVAADALIELEYDAIIPVLEMIEEQFDSSTLRESAHHVLHSLKELQMLDKRAEEVLDALKVNELPSKAAFIASSVLEYFRARGVYKFRGGMA